MDYLRGFVWGVADLSFVVDAVKCEDEGEMFMVPWQASCEGGAACCDMDEPVVGSVMLIPTISGPIEHGGLQVVLEQYVHLRDPFVHTELGERVVTLCGPGVLEGEVGVPIQFPFRIELNGNEDGQIDSVVWLEGYNGHAFALRHTLRATLLRPWYAANSDQWVPLALYRIPLTGYDIPEVHEREQIFVDVGDGKSVRRNYLELDSKWMPAGGPLHCRLHLSDLAVSIDMARVLLIRGEFVGRRCAKEDIVLGHTFFGAPPVEVAQGENEGAVDVALIADVAEDGMRAAAGGGRGVDWYGNDAVLNNDYPRTRGYATRQDLGEEEGGDMLPFEHPVLRGTVITADLPLGPSCPSGLDMALDARTYAELTFMDLAPSFDSKELLEKRSILGKRDAFRDSSARRVRTTTIMQDDPEPSSSSGRNDGGRSDSCIQGLVDEASPRLDEEEQVAVRYFLRLVLQNAHGDSFWNTHEIKLYRASRPTVISEGEARAGVAV